MWRPNMHYETLPVLKSLHSSDDDESYLNSSSKFATLEFQGKLIPIVARDDFSIEPWTEICRLPEVPEMEDTNACFEHPKIRNIRKICPISDPYLIYGWGSFEHPEFQDEESFSSRNVSAFPISWYSTACGGKDLQVVLSVLFVRSIQIENEEHFQRVGVGRLFGPVFEENYNSAEIRTVKLC
jgi:hypothetical protein